MLWEIFKRESNVRAKSKCLKCPSLLGHLWLWPQLQCFLSKDSDSRDLSFSNLSFPDIHIHRAPLKGCQKGIGDMAVLILKSFIKSLFISRINSRLGCCYPNQITCKTICKKQNGLSQSARASVWMRMLGGVRDEVKGQEMNRSHCLILWWIKSSYYGTRKETFLFKECPDHPNILVHSWGHSVLLCI